MDISRDIVGVAEEVHVAIRSAPYGLQSTTAKANFWLHSMVVVIIGYNPSGMDISRDIVGVAEEVHVAIRSAPYGLQSTTAKANFWLHSMIERAEEDGTIVFQDGSGDVITLVKNRTYVWSCLEYKYSFPFLGDGNKAAGICVDDNQSRPILEVALGPPNREDGVGPLYKHVFPPQLAPHIAFIGLPFKGIPFPLFQLQSNWVAGVLSGRIELPSQEKMMHDVETFYLEMEARGCPKRYTHGLTPTFEYEDWLVEQCGLEKIEEWRKVIHIAARTKVSDQPESYRDEWDDDHFLAQAHNDFTKYF
ncbi:hypothetical protein ACQ4PT_000189 [Festuca glaucescens]